MKSKRTIKSLLAALPAIATTLAHAAISNLSDVWHDPADPGWGVNIVQQGDLAMVTVMVYAADGDPLWYVAAPATAYAWSGDGLPYLRGALYRTRGRTARAVLDADAPPVLQVGEIYVSPVDRGRARLDYTVDGVAVSRAIERFTWSLPATYATWMSVVSLRVTADDRTVTQQTTHGTAALNIEDGVATLTMIGPQERCEYRGSYRQMGRLGSFGGEFACGDLRAGRFEIDDLEITTHGVSGRLRATWAGGSGAGTFGGARR